MTVPDSDTEPDAPPRKSSLAPRAQYVESAQISVPSTEFRLLSAGNDMRIIQLESQLLRLPLSRPITSLGGSDADNRLDHIFMLLVYLDTDAGHRGLGFAYTL